MPDPTMLQIAARMLATTRSFWTSPDKTAGTVPETDPSASVHPPVSRHPAIQRPSWRPTLLAHADY